MYVFCQCEWFLTNSTIANTLTDILQYGDDAQSGCKMDIAESKAFMFICLPKLTLDDEPDPLRRPPEEWLGERKQVNDYP